ncbi:hypothetical protein CEXT_9361, partial [Caerostris extrusa]
AVTDQPLPCCYLTPRATECGQSPCASSSACFLDGSSSLLHLPIPDDDATTKRRHVPNTQVRTGGKSGNFCESVRLAEKKKIKRELDLS